MTQLAEHTDDKAVWQNIKAGDKQCFNRLFKKYYSELYYYGIKIFHEPDLVKECIQEVFMRIWETRRSLGDAESVKSYLVVSVRRMILLHLKKDRDKQHVEIMEIENSAFYFDVNEFEKHGEISDEVRQALLTAINSLTTKQRELIMLFFYHELSYSEISQVVGISVQAARNLMYRTLIHLRESIGEKSLQTIRNTIFLLFSSLPVKKEVKI